MSSCFYKIKWGKLLIFHLILHILQKYSFLRGLCGTTVILGKLWWWILLIEFVCWTSFTFLKWTLLGLVYYSVNLMLDSLGNVLHKMLASIFILRVFCNWFVIFALCFQHYAGCQKYLESLHSFTMCWNDLNSIDRNALDDFKEFTCEIIWTWNFLKCFVKILHSSYHYSME